MHHANYYYGHAHLLARYCGLADPTHIPRIRGYLQHGWNIGDGQAPGVPYVEGAPMFVWSTETRRRAWSQGRRNVIVTGAPFAYLLAMEAGAGAGSPPAVTDAPLPHYATAPPQGRWDGTRDGTIFYPFHGWEGQQVRGSHQRLIDEVRATESGRVTACLYWNEYRQRRIRRRYERAGFRVICNGYRGFWWRDHDREFLIRQLAELRRHRRVVSNRLCSAVWYGLLAGCEAAVYGDPMVLDQENPTFGGEARIRRQWAPMHGPQTDLAECQALARHELGADLIAGPAELASHFGWTAAEPSSTGRGAGAGGRS